jgi:hypothetical protein
VIAVLMVAMVIALKPYYAAAFQGMIAQMPPERAAQAQAGAGMQMTFALIFTPITALLALVVGAGLLWVVASLTGTEASYKLLLSVLAYTYVTYLLMSIVAMAILMTRGVAIVSSFQDLRPPIGLDFLAPNAKGFVGGLLNAINPFSIWGVWLTGVGIAVTHKTSRGSGITIAAITFLIGAAISALLAGLQGM